MLKENPTEAAEMVDNDTFFSEDAPELAAGLDQTERENEPPPPVLPEYEAIVAQHSDFAGWITIDGTKIDYPVMLTPNDGDYYLKRNVNGEDDINGTLFMDPRTDLVQRSTNIIIYGHNMKSGAMFGSLKKYLDEDYWREHAQIRFDTIYEKGTYEVFAVCQRCSTGIHRNFVIMILYRRIPRRRLTTTSIISYNSRCLPEQICRSTGTSY